MKELTEHQREFIDRVLNDNVRNKFHDRYNLSREQLTQLSTVITFNQYSESDQKLLNRIGTWYFKRLPRSKKITLGSIGGEVDYTQNGGQEPFYAKVEMTGMSDGDWYKVHYGDWENVGEEVPLIREFGKDYNK